MQNYSLSHLADSTLLKDLRALVARDRATTAELLAHIAEVDARRLYAPAGYPSMYAYCVGELRLSEDAAFKRIKAARAARRCPGVFPALAQGRLHLSAVVLLAPHLHEETAEELLAAATHKSKAEVEQLVAERFPRPELLAWVDAMPSSSPSGEEQRAPGPVEKQASPVTVPVQPIPEPCGNHHRVTPLAPRRFALQVTLGQDTHEKLRYAQALLSHQVPGGELAEVLDRVLDLAIGQIEKRKFAATDRPRGRRRPATAKRTVPAHVRRAVWARDHGQCTFVGATGHRCAARRFLQFDHVTEVARGGNATVTGIRLRCRAHNQYTAECAFGAGFMARKRAEARAAATARAQAEAGKAAEARARAAEEARQSAERRRQAAAEVIPWLRQLGLRSDEARRAAARCEAIPEAPLEERVRLALSCFAKRAS